MRYERAGNLLELAMALQGARGGLTLQDIQRIMGVSRRTAERARDAVDRVFGPLELVPSTDRKQHWRLRSNVLRSLVNVSGAEINELEQAADGMERAGHADSAENLRTLAKKLKAVLHRDTLTRAEAELEALVQIEGLAARSGPRQRLDTGLLELLREAIGNRRVIEFTYHSPQSGERRRRVLPLGLINGNRTFLVARTPGEREPALWRLSRIDDAKTSGMTFERDPDFDLNEFARRSFGTYQEAPFEVKLKFGPEAAEDAQSFEFHPSQQVELHADGSTSVKFTAGGALEICWHLDTWGESATVEKPADLRMKLAEMCAALAQHHGLKAE